MIEEKSKTEKGLFYMLIGANIGAVLAFLFAPKTGKQLRGDIRNAARKSLDKTEGVAAELSEKAQTFYQNTKSKADEFYESAKRKIDSAAASITEKNGEVQNAVGNKGVQIAACAADGKKKSDDENKNSDHSDSESESRQNFRTEL